MSTQVPSSAPFPVDGLLPKQVTNAAAFLARYPEYDGRGVRVGVLDTGVDPAALGLDGPNKVVDVIDCSGAGDVPLQVVEAEEAEEGGALALTSPVTGRRLLISPSWRNPTGVWKVGTKRAYDLWPTSLVERRTAERKQAFDVTHAQLLDQALADVAAFDAAPPSDEDAAAKAWRRAELSARVDALKAMHKTYQDLGPVLEAVVFHDGTHWRAVVGGGEGDVHDPALGVPSAATASTLDLRARPALTDFRTEREWAYFGERDLLTYTVNILDDGALLSIVTLSGTHGTHVAGIIASRTDEAATNGVAPGAEIVSLRIGDARLGSMETGQALLRAAQALVDTQCDVANMSYGEDGGFFLENQGAFAEALQTVIRERQLLFVSSAGNEGPALSTVGQPGGTTSNVLSVGAYVSDDAMQQAEYALVEQNVPSSVTTWCSRGPCADGAAGVSVYAPGAAITSVCRYDLQSKALMNGTSMSSPNAAGAVALLVSACRAEGIPVSPARVFGALRRSGRDVHDPLGVPLLDVDKAWEYLQAHRDDPYADVEMQVHVAPAGHAPNAKVRRGVYLREAEETHRTSQHLVTVTPTFADGQVHQSYHMEARVALESTAPWVRAPRFLALSGRGRTFEIRVAADDLPPGLHATELIGRDTATDAVLFAVPVTVAKPVVPLGASHAFPRVHLAAGAMRREFIQVPHGATWAEIRVRSHQHEAPGTSVKFWLHLVQIEPQRRRSTIQTQSVMALFEGEPVAKKFRVQGGLTLEVCAAQFWASKAGFELEYDLEFHGLAPHAPVIDASIGQGLARIDVQSHLRLEELKPSAVLDTRRRFVRPTKQVLRPRVGARDRTPSGHQMLELVLEYPLSVPEATSLTWSLPLSGHLYDASVALLTQLVDVHHTHIEWGDVYPKEVKLAKGEYTLRVQALHTQSAVLEKLQTMPLSVDEKLKKEVALDVYPSHIALLGDGATLKDARRLLAGDRAVLCLDTNLGADSFPKEARAGDQLRGTLTLGAHNKVPLRVAVSTDAPAPPKREEDKPAPTPLPTLLAQLAAKVPKDDKPAYMARLAADYPHDLSVRRAALDAADSADQAALLEAARNVVACVDETQLRLFLGTRLPLEHERTAEQKHEAKLRAAEKDALAAAYLSEAEAWALTSEHDKAADAMKHAQQYIDDDSNAPLKTRLELLRMAWHKAQGRYGLALQGVRKQLDDLGLGTTESKAQWDKARALELELLQQLEWPLWHAYTERWSWWHHAPGPEPF